MELKFNLQKKYYVKNYVSQDTYKIRKMDFDKQTLLSILENKLKKQKKQENIIDYLLNFFFKKNKDLINKIKELEESNCVICQEHKCNIVYIECGHLCICESCKIKLETYSVDCSNDCNNNNEEKKELKCPICRKEGKSIKVYKVQKQKT